MSRNRVKHMDPTGLAGLSYHRWLPSEKSRDSVSDRMNEARKSTGGDAVARSLPELIVLEGVFYALLRIPKQEAPVRIALHGITSPEQAQEALRTLQDATDVRSGDSL